MHLASGTYFKKLQTLLKQENEIDTSTAIGLLVHHHMFMQDEMNKQAGLYQATHTKPVPLATEKTNLKLTRERHDSANSSANASAGATIVAEDVDVEPAKIKKKQADQ